jgi:hypothetical protein
MALGDITIYSKDNGNGYPGDVNYAVATSATVPQILSGEPVAKSLGTATVSAMASAKPLVGTDYLVGVAATTSTEGTSGTAYGAVSVIPIDADVTYLISTLATSTYFGAYATGTSGNPSQTVYDLTVGSRVTLARTGGVGATQLGGTYTINSTDSSNQGCVVEELDISKYPGKVRFSFRKALSYKA